MLDVVQTLVHAPEELRACIIWRDEARRETAVHIQQRDLLQAELEVERQRRIDCEVKMVRRYGGDVLILCSSGPTGSAA
jgi:hypothetical protein